MPIIALFIYCAILTAIRAQQEAIQTSYTSSEFEGIKDTLDLSQEEAELIFDKIVGKLHSQIKKIRSIKYEFPETTLKKIVDNGGRLPESVARRLRKTGVVIIRKVIPQKEAFELTSSLIEYLYQNGIYPKNDSKVRKYHCRTINLIIFVF